MTIKRLPALSSENGLDVLKAIIRNRSILSGLSAMHQHLGSPFQITLPVFQPVVLAGPKSNRSILVQDRHNFLWRTEQDPVTRLLRRGVLVVDGQEHDEIRGIMDPSLHRGHVRTQIKSMWEYTSRVLINWRDGHTYDMLIEMRKVALLILMGTLFGEDVEKDLDRIWHPILKSIDYISPGPWVMWPAMPRPAYNRPLDALDEYLYSLIENRRKQSNPSEDLLTVLVQNPELDNDVIRDQLLTMLIAGHDTSTALLAWALYLLGKHPESLQKAQEEIDQAFEEAKELISWDTLLNLTYIDAVIKETLRMYPPIHIGNRQAAEDITIQGYPVPKGQRVMYSIYLSHRDPDYWEDPDIFNPERFIHSRPGERPPFTYVPFGGGPRNCIGAAFSQIEAKVVLAAILHNFELQLINQDVYAHMGATLEPRPGVKMIVKSRKKYGAE